MIVAQPPHVFLAALSYYIGDRTIGFVVKEDQSEVFIVLDREPVCSCNVEAYEQLPASERRLQASKALEGSLRGMNMDGITWAFLSERLTLLIDAVIGVEDDSSEGEPSEAVAAEA